MKVKEILKRAAVAAVALMMAGSLAGCGGTASKGAASPKYVYDSGMIVAKGETAGVAVIKYTNKTLLIYEDGTYIYKNSFSSDMTDVGNSLGGYTKVCFGKYTTDSSEDDATMTYTLEKPTRVIQTNNIIATTEMSVDTDNPDTYIMEMGDISSPEEAVDWILSNENAIGASYLSNGDDSGAHKYVGTVTVDQQTFKLLEVETATY